MEEKKKIVIGREEVADFPELELFGVSTKIDTGAYTSSFHCHNIEVVDGILKCQFLDPAHDQFHDKIFQFKDFSVRSVKSSNGLVEKRFAIRTSIFIFNKSYQLELTLTERESMRFPVLLGRKFISRKFIVDSAKKNLSLKNRIIKI